MAVLKKLLKYDFRSNLKIFLFIWPGIILLALSSVIFRLLPSGNHVTQGLEVSMTVAYCLGLVGACILALVVSILRFYKGLLRDEGYLMFTLPVTTGRLILSKFIVALVTVPVTCLLSIGGMWLVFFNLERTSMLSYLILQLRSMSGEDWLTLALSVLVVFAGLASKLAQVYFSCSIGHLAKKHRVLLSVVCYYGISVALETVSVMFFSTLNSVTELVIFRMSMLQLLLVMVLILSALAAVYLVLTRTVLNRRLNLE